RALAQAAAVSPAPWFLVVTGDLTQGNRDNEFAAFEQGIAGLAPPVVAVRGNHDSYDGGVNFEKYLGPATYSFDAAGAHFVGRERGGVAGGGSRPPRRGPGRSSPSPSPTGRGGRG